MRDDPTPPSPSKWQSNRWVRVGVRVLRTYIQGAIGFLGLSIMGNVVPGSPVPAPTDALEVLKIVFYAPLFPALMALLMNGYEELNAIDPGTMTRG